MKLMQHFRNSLIDLILWGFVKFQNQIYTIQLFKSLGIWIIRPSLRGEAEAI